MQCVRYLKSLFWNFFSSSDQATKGTDTMLNIIQDFLICDKLTEWLQRWTSDRELSVRVLVEVIVLCY